MNWSTLILTSLVLSIPYGIGHWMTYQSQKQGTLIPYGSFTLAYGLLIAIIFKLICYIIITWLFISSKFNWLFLIAIPLVWIISGFIARNLERMLYAKARLEAFEYHAQRFVEQFGEDGAIKEWSNAVPRWWLNLMSTSWRKKYKKVVGKHLKSIDVTDLLFDREKYNYWLEEQKKKSIVPG